MSGRDIAVVGAGVMGHGLAVQFARTGNDVTLIDHRESNLERACTQIREAAEFLHEESLTDRSPDDVADRIDYTLDTAAGVDTADLVLETVSEDVGVKHEVLENVVAAAPEDAVIASNTSGIPPTELAEGVPDAADRVIVCHWWNPPYLMPLVEVVPGEETSEATLEWTLEFVESVDRNPIVAEREVPGFVWNRIQFAVIRECLHLVEEGVASLEDVEAAVRDGYALRTAVVGPFETADLAGVDLFRTNAENLFPELCDGEPLDLFDERLAEGRTGVAEGAGFFEYDEPESSLVARRNRRIAAVRRALGDDDA